MTPPKDRQALIDRFTARYRRAEAPVVRQMIRNVCGCDYGATSWTTKPEAEDAARRMGLSPGQRLLEVGAGAGWPGLYLAKFSGCDAALADLPFNGLQTAQSRASEDKMSGSIWPVLADGVALPFADASFDAVYHSDVLCCLAPKAEVLGECRRVIKPGGCLLFAVIHVADGLAPDAQALAEAGGPAHVVTETAYPDLISQAGWQITEQVDLSQNYGDKVAALLDQERGQAEALSGLMGAQVYQDELVYRKSTLTAVQAGVLKRSLFAARPQT